MKKKNQRTEEVRKMLLKLCPNLDKETLDNLTKVYMEDSPRKGDILNIAARQWIRR